MGYPTNWPGGVVGHIATAVALHQRDVMAGEVVIRRQDMCPFGGTAQRDSRWVLQEEYRIFTPPLRTCHHLLSLPLPCLLIGDNACMQDVDGGRGGGWVSWICWICWVKEIIIFH